MKKRFILLTLLLLLPLVIAEENVSLERNPNIWLTLNACNSIDNALTNINTGENIFLNGQGFGALNQPRPWKIEGTFNSSNPDEIIANGTLIFDDVGDACVEAYIVKEENLGEYRVYIGPRFSNITINQIILNETNISLQNNTINDTEQNSSLQNNTAQIDQNIVKNKPKGGGSGSKNTIKTLNQTRSINISNETVNNITYISKEEKNLDQNTSKTSPITGNIISENNIISNNKSSIIPILFIIGIIGIVIYSIKITKKRGF